eukprot:14364761-Alexandrium_andersonii.AAC.1
MSASLVGSEMCIRDSRGRPGRRPGRRRIERREHLGGIVADVAHGEQARTAQHGHEDRAQLAGAVALGEEALGDVVAR